MKTTLIRAALICSLAWTGASGTAHAQVDPWDPIVDWCNDSLRTLEQYRQQARMLESRLEFESAKETLFAGLQAASGNPGPWQRRTGPMTARAISRMYQIARSVEIAAQSAPIATPASSTPGDLVNPGKPFPDDFLTDTRGDRTTIAFLEGAYDFIGKVAHHIDIPFYIPYRWDPYYPRCRNCSERGFEEQYSQALEEMAADQIEMVLTVLTYRGYPFGASGAFLKALELALRASAFDLRDSLTAASFACQIGQIESLSARLSAFSNGERRLWRSVQQAFYASQAEAKYLVHQIRYSNGCDPYSRRR